MTLLVGDATTTYSNADTITSTQIQCFAFTASKSGVVDTLEFRTGGATNTSITGVILGIYADGGAGTAPVVNTSPLGSGTASGQPATNTWVTVSGLSISVTSGTVYWLAALPLAANNTFALSYNDAVTSGGTNIVVSIAANLSSMGSVASWTSDFLLGPIGFQGLNTGPLTGGGLVVDQARVRASFY